MSEIKIPNWRLSSVAQASTGHHYQITDRRTEHVMYFDNVRVFDGGQVDQVKFYREDDDMGEYGARAGRIRNTEQFPTVILDALKTLQGGGTITELGVRVNE